MQKPRPDIRNVETLYPFQAPINVGDMLTIVDSAAEVPRAIVGVCESVSPLMLELTQNPGFRRGERVLVVQLEGNRIVQAAGQVAESRASGGRWHVQVSADTWSELDRRADPRVAVDLEGEIAFVQEGSGDSKVRHLKGSFKDLSASGGWFEAPELEPRGALVNWCLQLPEGGVARGIALVARSCPKRGGMGLEFVDFVEQSSTRLKALLQRAA